MLYDQAHGTLILLDESLMFSICENFQFFYKNVLSKFQSSKYPMHMSRPPPIYIYIDDDYTHNQ